MSLTDDGLHPDPEAPVYLISSAGHPNFGDEFIVASWLRFLARARPEAEIWLDSPNPGMAAHLFRTLHPRLRATDTLWRLMAEVRGLEPDAADAHIDHRVAHLGTPRYDLGLLDVREAGSLHVLGGGYMNALWPRQDRLLRAAARVSDISGAKIAATGQGLMPLADPAWTQELVERFDHFAARDQATAEATGAEAGLDDAFLGLGEVPGFGAGGNGEAEEVWINIQSDVGSPEAIDAAVAAVRAALTSPEYADRPVRYLEGIPGVDRIAFDRLADLIGEDGFVPFARLWREGFPARPGQTWLTTRFHFHLLAAASGAEGSALVIHDDYYGVKHGSLLDLGTGWSLTAPGSAEITPPASAVRFRSAASSLRQRKLREAQLLYPAAAPPAPVAPQPAARPAGRFGRVLGR